MKITKKARLLAVQPIGRSTDGTLTILKAQGKGYDWRFTGSGFEAWRPGERGIPRIDFDFGVTSGQGDDFVVSEDGTSFSLTEEQAKINADLLGGPTDGIAVIYFCPGPEQGAESIRVPFHYESAQE